MTPCCAIKSINQALDCFFTQLFPWKPFTYPDDDGSGDERVARDVDGAEQDDVVVGHLAVQLGTKREQRHRAGHQE